MGYTRRDAIVAGAAAGTALLTRGTAAAATDWPWTVGGLARAMDRGDLSPLELAAEVARRIEAGRGLGAFISSDTDRMTSEAGESDLRRLEMSSLSPLDGIPIAFKDNIDITGIPTTAATPALAAHRPAHTAPAAQRLFDVGALMAGKTNLHELAGGGTTSSRVFGRARNPYKPEHIPGGSSGGSAVAVAARLVPAAIGSDSAGSIRNPAHFCGIVGFKASVGRYPATGVVPLSRRVDTVGPMTLNVTDAALIDGYMAADPARVQATRLRDMRLGVPRLPFQENLDTEVEALFGAALERLTAAGVTLVEAEIPNLKADIASLGWLSLGGQLKSDLEMYLAESGSDVTVAEIATQIDDPFVRDWMLPFLDPTPEVLQQYDAAVKTTWPAYNARYANYLAEHRLNGIIFPTSPVPAGIATDKPGDLIIAGELVEGGSGYNIQNTHAASLWGAPGISLPMGMTADGLPVGIEIDAGVGQDKQLLAIALAVEETLPDLPAPDNATLKTTD